jgi:hypothetical protein
VLNLGDERWKRVELLLRPQKATEHQPHRASATIVTIAENEGGGRKGCLQFFLKKERKLNNKACAHP